MVDPQTGLKAFLNDFQLFRARFPGEWPRFEAGRHQGFVSRKVDHGTHAVGTDELTAAQWLQCRHGVSYRSGYKVRVLASHSASTLRIEEGVAVARICQMGNGSEPAGYIIGVV